MIYKKVITGYFQVRTYCINSSSIGVDPFKRYLHSSHSLSSATQLYYTQFPQIGFWAKAKIYHCFTKHTAALFTAYSGKPFYSG